MQFKNINKPKRAYHRKKKEEDREEEKEQVSPKISRSITERPKFRLQATRTFWLQVASLLALAGFFVVSVNIYGYFKIYKQVQEEKRTYGTKLSEWDNLLVQHPGNRDGYLQAAILAYQLGEDNKSRVYVQKALQIDPNFLPARKMAAFVGIVEKENVDF